MDRVEDMINKIKWIVIEFSIIVFCIVLAAASITGLIYLVSLVSAIGG